MSGYLKQKLFQALHDLVGAGDLDQRLTHARNYLAHVQDHEVPEEHRKELGEIKAIMFATPLSSERGYSPREISTEDGTKLAHRILELYTKVMGGLQASHPPPIAGAQGEEMTKTPGEFEPPKPIKAERAARKAFRQVDAEKAMTENEMTQKAFSTNRERLKAERLAREAAETPRSGSQSSTDGGRRKPVSRSIVRKLLKSVPPSEEERPNQCKDSTQPRPFEDDLNRLAVGLAEHGFVGVEHLRG